MSHAIMCTSTLPFPIFSSLFIWNITGEEYALSLLRSRHWTIILIFDARSCETPATLGVQNVRRIMQLLLQHVLAGWVLTSCIICHKCTAYSVQPRLNLKKTSVTAVSRYRIDCRREQSCGNRQRKLSICSTPGSADVSVAKVDAEQEGGDCSNESLYKDIYSVKFIAAKNLVSCS